MKCTQVKKNFSHCTLYVCSARPKSFPVKCQGHVVLLQYIIIQSRTQFFFCSKKERKLQFPQNSKMKFFITPTPLVPLRLKKILELFLPFRQIPQKVYCPIKLHISYSDFSIFFCIFYRILEHSNFYPFVTLNSNIKFNEEGEHQYIFKKRVKFKYLKRGNHLKNVDL